MLKGRMHLRAALLISTFFLVTGGLGQVQAETKYPSKGIDFIVPMKPGGGTDTACRIAAEYLKKKMGDPHKCD